MASTTSLVAGEYTVKVTGAAEGHDSKTVTVAAEKVGKIEFASDKLVKTDANSATTTTSTTRALPLLHWQAA